MTLTGARFVSDSSLAGLMVVGLFFAAPGQGEANLINAKSASLADVNAAVALAHDGDTVMIPAGTANWASRLEITKGLTLQGATTIVGPPSRPTVTDATIIQDDTPRTGPAAGIIKATVNPNHAFRLTGFTFRAGAATRYAGGNGAIHVLGTCPSVRIDHCHFDRLYQKDIWISGSIYGVADHCVFDCLPASFSFLIWHDTWGGQINGNGSWADPPYWGSEKFFFIEDNTINGSGVQTSGTIDAKCGARYVARYNTFNNAKVNSHGTEGGPQRGVRAIESYNNTFNWTMKNSGGQIRSGVVIAHDNTWSGTAPPSAHVLTCYRQFNNFKPLGGANGNNPRDVNDTEGNGTNVPGRRPHLYLSGTHAGGSNSQTLVVPGAGWTANQWAGYEVTNTATGANSVILSNTSDTITVSIYADTKTPLRFNAGDKFAIYKLLSAMDQPGRGKSDLTNGGNKWPRNALEPCYAWNNMANGKAIGLSSPLPTIQENRDYYNRVPQPGDSIYPYTPYVYPHPLVKRSPSPGVKDRK